MPRGHERVDPAGESHRERRRVGSRTILPSRGVRETFPASTVAVSTGVADGYARLTVENTGPLIPAYAVPTLFQPFRRLPAGERLSGQGAGLGLSIVAAIAQAHGGDVRAWPREHGGLRVRVRIPVSTPTDARG